MTIPGSQPGVSGSSPQPAQPHGPDVLIVRPMRVEEVLWIEPPQHHGAYSKLLVNPDTSASRHFDFRLSLYRPKGYAEDHVHEHSEHVYYVLQGRGLMRLGVAQHVVEPHTVIFIPPGVVHSLTNTGLEDLIVIVATAPPGELPRSEGGGA